MDTLQRVELMTDDQVLTTFGTAEDPERRGFDESTYTRVVAYELVRARNRLTYYRTLYASFIEGGKPFMIENLADGSDDGAVPAKLLFTEDADHVMEVEEQPEVVVWTEPALLEALVYSRSILDYCTELLNELEPAVLTS